VKGAKRTELCGELMQHGRAHRLEFIEIMNSVITHSTGDWTLMLVLTT